VETRTTIIVQLIQACCVLCIVQTSSKWMTLHYSAIIILTKTICAVIFMHIHITAFFATSQFPVLGIRVPVRENRKLQYGFLYSRHFLHRDKICG